VSAAPHFRPDGNEVGTIQLTRLINKPLTVNSDLIKFVEHSPDTLVTLTTSEKIVVQEIIRLKQLTRLANSLRFAGSVMNLSGKIIPVIALRMGNIQTLASATRKASA
jgi:uncharacterized protein YlzI (FlbEa/FlbD family)